MRYLVYVAIGGAYLVATVVLAIQQDWAGVALYGAIAALFLTNAWLEEVYRNEHAKNLKGQEEDSAQ